MKSELKWAFAADDIVEDCDHEGAVKVEDGAGAGGKEIVVVETRDAADQKESPLSPTRVLSGSPPPLLASSPHHLDQPPLPDLS